MRYVFSFSSLEGETSHSHAARTGSCQAFFSRHSRKDVVRDVFVESRIASVIFNTDSQESGRATFCDATARRNQMPENSCIEPSSIGSFLIRKNPASDWATILRPSDAGHVSMKSHEVLFPTTHGKESTARSHRLYVK